MKPLATVVIPAMQSWEIRRLPLGYQLIAHTAPSKVWHWPLPCSNVLLVPRHSI